MLIYPAVCYIYICCYGGGWVWCRSHRPLRKKRICLCASLTRVTHTGKKVVGALILVNRETRTCTSGTHPHALLQAHPAQVQDACQNASGGIRVAHPSHIAQQKYQSSSTSYRAQLLVCTIVCGVCGVCPWRGTRTRTRRRSAQNAAPNGTPSDAGHL